MPRLQDAGIVVLGFVLFLSESVSAIVLGALNVVILWDGNVDGYDRESSVKSCQRSRFSKTVCSSSGERHQKVTYGASVTTASEVFRGDLLVDRWVPEWMACDEPCGPDERPQKKPRTTSSSGTDRVRGLPSAHHGSDFADDFG